MINKKSAIVFLPKQRDEEIFCVGKHGIFAQHPTAQVEIFAKPLQK